MKVKQKITLIFVLLTLMFAALGIGMYGLKGTTAMAAAIHTTPKCLTYGKTDNGQTVTYGCPSNFKVYMYGSNTSGTDTIYEGDLFHWSYYYITVETSEVSEHTSFKLYKNGSTYVNKTLSGNSDITLYSGELPGGEYKLEYICRYRKNFVTAYMTYTYTYEFEVDEAAPFYEYTIGGRSSFSNSYANEEIIYKAADTNFYSISYKSPNIGAYLRTYNTTYTVKATADNNGKWYFYATDKVGNESDVSWMYLDTVAPIGTVTDTNGVTVANGGYTNKAIKYTATDAGGISYCELKKPYTEEWVKYTPGTSIAEMYGWYTFRAVDKAGNVSEEYKVYYDISAPAGTLYGETTKLSSGSYTNAAYIKYEAIDVYGGIESSYVKMPGSSGYTKYALGTMLETEGTYSFYAVDKCGNKSDTMIVTLDKTKPTGSLYAGNSIIDSGSITNAETISFIPQDEFGIAEVFVKRPEDNEFTEYKQGTSYTEEGTYSFYCVDRAGNISDCYELTLDREIPKGQLYVDGEPWDNGSYTNGAYIRFECEETCYVKQPDSEDFTEYVSGTEYYRPGKYIYSTGFPKQGTRRENSRL